MYTTAGEASEEKWLGARLKLYPPKTHLDIIWLNAVY